MLHRISSYRDENGNEKFGNSLLQLIYIKNRHLFIKINPFVSCYSFHAEKTLKSEYSIRAGSILSERQDHSKGTRWGGGHLFSLDPPAFSRRESVQDVFLSCRSAPLLLRIAVFIRRLPSPDFRRGAQIVAVVVFACMDDVFVRPHFARPLQFLIRHEPIH